LLTARGWWFSVFAAALLFAGVVGVGPYTPVVPLLGLALTGWVVLEWVLFAYRLTHAAKKLRLDRVLLQGGRAVPTAWAGLPITVRAVVTNCGTARLPFVLLADRVPAGAGEPTGSATRQASLGPDQSAAIEYTLRPDAPGTLAFEGVAVHVGDPSGLFYSRVFLREFAEYLVLPPLTGHDSRRRTVKRFNALPPPGVHRLKRAGSGDELLDLRDYAPGDPPKMIAWKASARRDALIVKEIESDVPVRVVLFADASNAARLGPPGESPVTRFAAVAAAVAQAAAGNRDLVGLTVVTDDDATAIAPARTRVHVLKLLHALTAAASELPVPLGIDADATARHAHHLAEELYPERTARGVNALPFGLFWQPLADSRLFLVFAALLALPLLLLSKAVLNGVATVAEVFAVLGRSWVTFAAIVVTPGVLAVTLWFAHGVRGFLRPRYGRIARRKQLALLFASLDRDGPATVERYQHDDGAFAARARDFLHSHRARLPLNLFAADGASRYRNPARLLTLANALTRTLGHARDNELYVVLVELAELAEELEPLLRAVRAARARHHAVVVLLPWPADLPWEAAATPPRKLKLSAVVDEVLGLRARQNHDDARRQLVRAGATVLRLDAADSVRLVLERLDRLRTAGGRR
jgi:uncharacterized protein (DUF58 family)